MAGIYTDYDESTEQIGALPLNSDTTIHAREWEGDFDPVKTKKVGLENITPAVPHPSDASLAGRVTLGAPTIASLEKDVTDYKTQLENAPKEPSRLNFPNLAWESVKAGLEKEAQINSQLNVHLKEAEKNQKDIDLLLDLSAELTSFKKDENKTTEKLKEILGELKERGINLRVNDEETLTEEKIAELKSLSSAQIDKLRSNLQILFTTKIQTLIQSISAILEILKDIIRNNNQLVRTANRLPGH
ncbi:MAG: hypothetical protein COT85_01705 [Chlamydiae bacterium CG10_big_fil_rev_8_21_14_0_10_42_34]|nr:MAG: hypothetical protein COT85_01705 [Chlamydiae bacterium CG10_big_fil_rev_8_21_14_0_10_42_34]